MFPGADQQLVTQLLERFLATGTLDQALNRTMDRLLDEPLPQERPQEPEITVRFQALSLERVQSVETAIRVNVPIRVKVMFTDMRTQIVENAVGMNVPVRVTLTGIIQTL